MPPCISSYFTGYQSSQAQRRQSLPLRYVRREWSGYNKPSFFCMPSKPHRTFSVVLHLTLTVLHLHVLGRNDSTTPKSLLVCFQLLLYRLYPLWCEVTRASGVRFCGALCHEKHFLLPRLAEAETFRQTGGGRRGLHQIQQCRLCAESECIRSSLPE